jgi:hypothetical protein
MKKEKMRQEKDDIHDRPPNLSFKQSAKGVRLLNSSLSVLICASKHEIAQLTITCRSRYITVPSKPPTISSLKVQMRVTLGDLIFRPEVQRSDE